MFVYAVRLAQMVTGALETFMLAGLQILVCVGNRLDQVIKPLAGKLLGRQIKVLKLLEKLHH